MTNVVVRSLRRIGGATPEIDRPEVSQKTRNGYTVLGMLILIVALMSSSIAGFTWGSVMHTAVIGIGVALVWLCFSGALSYMMAWIIDAARGRRGGLITMVVTILCFGALISAVNTNFVLLWMMDPEIRQTLQANYQADRSELEQGLVDNDTKLNRDLGALRMRTDAAIIKIRSEGGSQIAVLKADADKARKAYTDAYAEYTAEVRGQGPSKMVGIGQRAKAAKEQIDALKVVMDAADKRLQEAEAKLDPALLGRIAEANNVHTAEETRLKNEHAAAKSRTERNIKELDLVPRDGFVNRDLALWSLVRKDPHFMFIFMALFFLIESLVALVKLLMGKTDYLMLLDAISADKLRDLAQRTARSDAERRAAEFASRQEAAVHRKRLHQLDTEEHNDVLAQSAARRQAIEDHLKGLVNAGVPEEAIEGMRANLLKEEQRRFGKLRVVK